MPEIIRCRECDRETYMGIAACPHCGADLSQDQAAHAAEVATSGSPSGGAAANAIALVVVRLLIFNGAYWATISAIEIYDKVKYGNQAVPGGADPAVALFILGGFVLLNLVYLAIEGACWHWLKGMRPIFHLVFPVASFVGISVFLLLVMFLRNL